MHCVRCSRVLPADASHCPYCGTDVGNLSTLKAEPGGAAPQAATAERPTFCVKCGAALPAQAAFCTQCSTPRTSIHVEPANPPDKQPQPVPGLIVCPRCHATNVTKGAIAQWALITGIVGALFTCGLSLLLLLVKDPNRCLNCAFEFK